MSRKKLFYPKSEISKTKFAKQGELVKQDGTTYIGPYHESKGILYTGPTPSQQSEVVRPAIEKFQKENTTKYFQLTGKEFNNHISPVSYMATPTLENYRDGFFKRYFIQKKNQPTSTIIEVNEEQYKNVNTSNKTGINGLLYNKVSLDWTLKGKEVVTNNRKSIAFVENNFEGITRYLTNLVEFATAI